MSSGQEAAGTGQFLRHEVTSAPGRMLAALDEGWVEYYEHIDCPEFNYATWRWIRERGITTLAELRAYLEENEPEALAAAHQYVTSYETTGFITCRAWAAENWNTDRNASRFRDEKHGDQIYKFVFDTAWSFPFPVFRKLGAEFPTLVFTCEYLSVYGEYCGYCHVAGLSFDFQYGYYPEENARRKGRATAQLADAYDDEVPF